jgi:hypothetical protein
VPFVTWLRVVPVAFALTGIAAADLGLPSETFWADKKPWLYACLLVAFVTSVASQALASLAGRSAAERIALYESDTSAAMAATMMLAAEFLKVPVDRVGVHIFLVDGIAVRRRWLAARLVLVSRLRIGSSPTMHRPRWSIGKGVVGRAWLERSFVCEDWRTIYTEALAAEPDVWRYGDATAGYRMSPEELAATNGYQLIAAHPITALYTSPPRVIGCVALDAQTEPPADLARLEALLRSIAGVVERMPAPPRVWVDQRKFGY